MGSVILSSQTGKPSSVVIVLGRWFAWYKYHKNGNTESKRANKKKLGIFDITKHNLIAVGGRELKENDVKSTAVASSSADLNVELLTARCSSKRWYSLKQLSYTQHFDLTVFRCVHGDGNTIQNLART